MTQNVITNCRVTITGDEAECFSYVVATHYLPNQSERNIWLLMGYYEYYLVRNNTRWEIDRMKLTATLVDGTPELPQVAMEVVKKMA